MARNMTLELRVVRRLEVVGDVLGNVKLSYTEQDHPSVPAKITRIELTSEQAKTLADHLSELSAAPADALQTKPPQDLAHLADTSTGATGTDQ